MIKALVFIGMTFSISHSAYAYNLICNDTKLSLEIFFNTTTGKGKFKSNALSHILGLKCTTDREGWACVDDYSVRQIKLFSPYGGINAWSASVKDLHSVTESSISLECRAPSGFYELSESW